MTQELKASVRVVDDTRRYQGSSPETVGQIFISLVRLTRVLGGAHHRRCVLWSDIDAVRRGARVTRGSHDDQAKDDVTGLLIKLRQGDKSALDALIPLVYGELRRVASARLRGERAGQSLQTTALVHETYLRFVDLHRLTLENRTHFLAVAARLMRQILVDHARRAHAEKRGGHMTMVTVEADPPVLAPSIVDVLALDQALEELALMDERLCRVVELKFFAGLTIDETAEALDVSCATVERDWAAARAWLYDRLTPRHS